MVFNLNIDSYSNSELEDLLNLKGSYSSEDIKAESEKLKKQLSSKKNMSSEDKTKIIFFLDNVHDKLV